MEDEEEKREINHWKEETINKHGKNSTFNRETLSTICPLLCNIIKWDNPLFILHDYLPTPNPMRKRKTANNQ